MSDELDRLKRSDPAASMAPPKPGSSRFEQIREAAMTTTHSITETPNAPTQPEGWPDDELAIRRARRRRAGTGLVAAAAAVVVLLGVLSLSNISDTIAVEPATSDFTVERIAIPLLPGGVPPLVADDGSMVAVSRYNESPLRTLIGQSVRFRTFRSTDGVAWETVASTSDVVSHLTPVGENVYGLKGFGDPYQGVAGLPYQVMRLGVDDEWELLEGAVNSAKDPGWFGRVEIAAVGSTVIVSQVDLGTGIPEAEHYVGGDSSAFQLVNNVPAPLVQSSGDWFYASNPWGDAAESAFRSSDGVTWEELDSFGGFELAGVSNSGAGGSVTGGSGETLLWQLRPADGELADGELADGELADVFVSADQGASWQKAGGVQVLTEEFSQDVSDGRRGQQLYGFGPSGAAVVDGETLRVSRDGVTWESVDLGPALSAQQTGVSEIDEVFGRDGHIVYDLTVGTDIVLVHLRQLSDGIQLNETSHAALRVTLPD